MGAFWEWCWRRHRRHYSWAVAGGLFLTLAPTTAACGLAVLWFEDSDRYGLAAAIMLPMTLVAATLCVLPGSANAWGLAEHWIEGEPAEEALRSTYAFARGAWTRTLVGWCVLYGAGAVSVGSIAGASRSSTFQWGLLGVLIGATQALTGGHFWIEGVLRAVRHGLGGATGIGDGMPRSRPTFRAWMAIVMLTQAVIAAITGAIFGAIIGIEDHPGLAALLGVGMAAIVLPLNVALIVTPSLKPLDDLSAGTRRVSAGDYSQRLPVVQDDDLGALAASFNQMQAGLAERERLSAAFGSYVDPTLAQRLLAQGDDLFSGERVDVTVMFVDIRDFTPFAEANSAEKTVAHLNALFAIVVAVVVDRGGHVNKFLGDGAMVVFGAPERLDHHADRAVEAAMEIQRRIHVRFDGSTRVGIGINTGTVIAGTIGGSGKLEFTLIGDAVNVAARVEQLTKETGDGILLTAATASTLSERPALTDRGAHALKGKAEPVVVHALDPARG